MADYLFKDAHHALYECFAIVSNAVMPQGTLGRMMKKTRKSSPRWAGLSPLEKQAQAAQVVAIVEKMSDYSAREYIISDYMGFTGGEATKNLMNAVMAGLPTGVHQRRGVQAVLRNYFGHTVNARSMRYDLHCKQQDLADYRKNVGDIATKIGRRAMEHVEAQLIERGLIEPVYLMQRESITIEQARQLWPSREAA